MEPRLDLTLKLGLPVSDQTIGTVNSYQENNIGSAKRGNGSSGGDGNIFDHRRRFLGGGDINDDEGARNNVNANIKFSNYIFKRFSGAGNTSGHLPLPVDPATTTQSDCVIPAYRAQRNPSNATALHPNANANGNASFTGKRHERWKRCTNISCNTYETPMWYNGPFGPQTLCNACGIKYKIETEKRSRNNN